MTHRETTAPAVIATLAAITFLWQLGSSSLFVDEALSLNLTDGDLGHLVSGLRELETSPPAYSFILNAWVALVGSREDAIARLPSAVAAVGVAVIVWRLGLLVAGRRSALAAGLVAAASPLLLEYAQQARPYALLALMSSLTGMCALEAERRTSGRWLALSCVAAGAALWLHYTALLVVLPLALWIVVRTPFSRSSKAAFCAVQVVAWVVWVPLLIEQFQAHPEGGLGESGRLSRSHAARVLAAPFDTRYTERVGIAQAFGVVVMVAAVIMLIDRLRRDRRPDLELVLALAVVGPLGLLAGAVLGKDLLVTRYVVVVAPFMIVAVGVAVATARTALLGAALVGLALVVAVLGTLGTHRQESFFPDTREAVQRVVSGLRPGDLIVQAPSFGVLYTFDYYARRRLPTSVPIVVPGDPRIDDAIKARRRIWIVTLDAPANGRPASLPPGYERVSFARLPGVEPLGLTLAAPGSG